MKQVDEHEKVRVMFPGIRTVSNRTVSPSVKRTKRLGLLLLVVLGAVAVASVGYPGQVSAGVVPIDAIGRLVIDDIHLCTAFVVASVKRQVPSEFGGAATVYENRLVSAGHCYGQKLIFWQGETQYPVTRVLGQSPAGDEGYDVMVATFLGDQPMPTLEPAFGEFPKVGDKLMLIGYGRKALMMRVGPLLGYDERGRMKIENYASPGNSGGPVIIPATRRVVGIGIETTLDVPLGIPLVFCQLGSACHVKPPYIATHIDRILGVASFR